MQREGPRRATRCEILEGAERSEHGGSRCVVARRGSSPSAERSEHGGSRRVVARRGSSPIPRVPRGGRRATGGRGNARQWGARVSITTLFEGKRTSRVLPDRVQLEAGSGWMFTVSGWAKSL